jgi:hypothetical protein
MHIVNTDGTWLRNRSQFPLFDPETLHVFAPQQVVKIRRSDWAKSQSVIEIVPDPLAVAPVVAPVKPVAASTVKKVSPV